MNPIAKIDEWLQKRFDGAVHWLMHVTGCSKRQVRWWSYVAFIVTLTADTAIEAASHPEKAIQISTFGTIMALMWTSMAIRDDAMDAAAEDQGGRSRADAVSRWYVNLMKAAGVAILFMDATNIIRTVSDAVWLFQAFLLATGPRPPAKKRRTALKAVPA